MFSGHNVSTGIRPFRYAESVSRRIAAKRAPPLPYRAGTASKGASLSGACADSKRGTAGWCSTNVKANPNGFDPFRAGGGLLGAA